MVLRQKGPRISPRAQRRRENMYAVFAQAIKVTECAYVSTTVYISVYPCVHSTCIHVCIYLMRMRRVVMATAPYVSMRGVGCHICLSHPCASIRPHARPLEFHLHSIMQWRVASKRAGAWNGWLDWLTAGFCRFRVAIGCGEAWCDSNRTTRPLGVTISVALAQDVRTCRKHYLESYFVRMVITIYGGISLDL